MAKKIVIDEVALSDFLSGDGAVTGKALAARMDRYCQAVAGRMDDGTQVVYGKTNGMGDDVPDECQESYEEAAGYVADNLDTLVIK